jgi:hypothetical protein
LVGTGYVAQSHPHEFVDQGEWHGTIHPM